MSDEDGIDAAFDADREVDTSRLALGRGMLLDLPVCGADADTSTSAPFLWRGMIMSRFERVCISRC
jgi:hypothetical protein